MEYRRVFTVGEIASIKYQRKWEHQRFYYHYECCYNEYDNNIIYAVSNTGNTRRYDFEKNEWYELKKDGLALRRYLRHVSWMQNRDIIGVGNGHYFGSLDLRENTEKVDWRRLDEYTEMCNFNAKAIETF